VKLENVVLHCGKDRAILKLVDFDTVEEHVPGHLGYDVMGTDQYIAPEYHRLHCNDVPEFQSQLQ